MIPSRPDEKKLQNVYNHRLMIWLQDSVGDAFWDLESKLAPFMSHHVVSQLAMCFLSYCCWFQVWAGQVGFGMIPTYSLGYTCLLNLINWLNVVCSVKKGRFDGLPVPVFQIIIFFFWFAFQGFGGGGRKREKWIWETVDMLVYDPGREQSQNGLYVLTG